MSGQLVRAKKPLTSSKSKDYSYASISRGPRILNLAQKAEQKRQIDERRKKKDLGKFFITFCERKCIDFISTALIAKYRQKIAEAGMIANKSPSAIDWTIIPDAPILDENMDVVDSQLHEWEDVGQSGET